MTQARARAAAAVSIGVLMLLGGCGGSGGDSTPTGIDSTSSPSSTAATPSTAPSPTESPATVQQYASIVARNADIQKQLRRMQNCDWFGSGALDSDPASLECEFGVLTMSYQAKTLAISLSSASDESAPAYIGPPPDEISALVEETTQKAQALGRAAAKADHQRCEDSGAGACGSLRGNTWQAMNDLTDALQAWAPYL